MKFAYGKLSVILSASILLLNLTTVVSASPNKEVVKVVNYQEITDTDKLIELAVQQKEEKAITSLAKITDNEEVARVAAENQDAEDNLQALQVLKETTYSDGSIEKEVVVSALAGTYDSKSGSTGKYDVAAVVKLYYTWEIKSAQIVAYMDKVQGYQTDLNTNARYVTKFDLSYHGSMAIDIPTYDRYGTFNSPGSGITYSIAANDPTMYYQNSSLNTYGEILVTFDDKTTVSARAVLAIG